MDAGGLAQMSSFSNLTSGNEFNVPASGFTSRRGSAIKSLSFDHSKLPVLDNSTPTPRTSRSHLLAGLRTAPKNATNSLPMTAPPSQLEHYLGGGRSRYTTQNKNLNGLRTSHTSGQQVTLNKMCNNQMYATPDHILAPPEIHVDDFGYEQVDPNYYAHLVATNMYLAEQQQRLQQQLINVQVAAQQFQGMSLGSQQYSTPPITPRNFYQQQQSQPQNNVSQLNASSNSTNILPLYSCYNSMTGQPEYFQIDAQSMPLDQLVNNQQSINFSSAQRAAMSPRGRTSKTTLESGANSRSASPSLTSSSPAFDPVSLPPPSAGAFRRGHRKAPSSLALSEDSVALDFHKAPGFPKSNASIMSASLSGLGPGQGRVGEHPVRQPRGPPSIEMLIAKPTTKYEGTKNFATRTRRNAVNNLVRAGIERRKAPGSTGSGSMSPTSELGEVAFSVADNESDSGRSGSGSLTSRPALGSPRTSIHGAIGSNRPSSRQNSRFHERKSVASLDSNYTSATFSGDEVNSLGGKYAAVTKIERDSEYLDVEIKA